MKVLVSGSSGLIGSKLVRELKAHGHHVVHLTRHPRKISDPQIEWHPAQGQINTSDLDGIDAVIHLAGESIMGRWTEEKKRKIEQSRVKGTTLLANTIAQMASKPKVFICASAIGIYGNRGKEELTEVAAPGKGFLPKVCREWEEACQPARDAGIRTVNIRTGVVLSMKGGALKTMYWPFQLGVAGDLSFGGHQYFSWITLEDEVGAIIHCLENENIRGPVNLTAPNPVTNHEFTMALRRQLLPWPVSEVNLPLPGWKVNMLLGEMGEELLLASTNVKPVRLLETGYHFKHPTLKEALKAVI